MTPRQQARWMEAERLRRERDRLIAQHRQIALETRAYSAGKRAGLEDRSLPMREALPDDFMKDVIARMADHLAEGLIEKAGKDIPSTILEDVARAFWKRFRIEWAPDGGRAYLDYLLDQHTRSLRFSIRLTDVRVNFAVPEGTISIARMRHVDRRRA